MIQVNPYFVLWDPSKSFLWISTIFHQEFPRHLWNFVLCLVAFAVQMAFKDISSWFIQSYATCWANGEWLNNWANVGLCTFETETAFMNSWLYHCSFKQPKWYLNWSASSYLIFMIFFTEPQFEAKKVVLRQNSLWRFTRFFPVPIGNYYTWLILFTQQAVVMVLTNIRCVRWAGFHNLVRALVYLISLINLMLSLMLLIFLCLNLQLTPKKFLW